MAEALFQISEPGRVARQGALHAGFSRAVGIDLGTTNSLVAIGPGRRSRSVSRRQRRGDPASVVHYAADGDVVVGADARDRLAPRVPARHDRVGEAVHGPRAARRRGDAQAHAVPVRARGGDGGGVVRFAVARRARASRRWRSRPRS